MHWYLKLGAENKVLKCTIGIYSKGARGGADKAILGMECPCKEVSGTLTDYEILGQHPKKETASLNSSSALTGYCRRTLNLECCHFCTE